MAVKIKKIKVGDQHRMAEFMPASIKEAERTVIVSWGTGAPVRRWYDWDTEVDEILDMTEDAIDMSRMNSGNAGAFTDHHTSVDNQVGVVARSWVEDGEGFSEIRFSENDSVKELWQNVRDGIVKNVSIGYRGITGVLTDTDGDKIPTLRMTKWLPHEISFVGVGADATANVRSQGEEHELTITGAVRELPIESTDKEPVMTPEEIEAQRKADAIQHEAARKLATETAVREMKERMTSIRSLCDDHKIESVKRDELMDGDLSLDQVRAAVLDIKLEEQRSVDATQSTQATTTGFKSNLTDAVRGMADALSQNIAGAHGIKIDVCKEAADFKHHGRSIVGTARSILGMQDGDAGKYAAMSNAQVIDRAMNASGHFTDLIANVANKSLQSFYQEIPATWESLVDIASVSDFKTHNLIRVGESGDLKKVNEHGEYERSTVSESKETLNLLTYGRMIAFTRQLLINDDLNGLADAPRNFAQSVRRLESDLFWDMVTSNPNVGEDGLPVFDAAHGNLGTASLITDVSLSEARKNARLQRGLKGRDGSESKARLNVMMKYLIVAPGNETAAYKQLATIDPQNVAAVNEWAGKYEVIVEPRLEDFDAGAGAGKAWFLAADAMQAVGRIKAAYLDGVRTPFFDSMPKFENDGIEFKVRHDVGFAFSDFRGWSRNDGA